MKTISKYLILQQFRIYFSCVLLVIVLDSLDNLIAFYNGEPILLSVSLSMLLFLPTIALLSGLMSINGLRQSREFQAANLLGYPVARLTKPMMASLFVCIAATFALCQLSLSYATTTSFVYPQWHMQDDILLQLHKTTDNQQQVKSAWQLCCLSEQKAANNLNRTQLLDQAQISMQQNSDSLQLDITVNANNTHKKIVIVPEQQQQGSPIIALIFKLQSEFLSQAQRNSLTDEFYLQLIILFDAIVFGVIGLLVATILSDQFPRGFVLILGIIFAYLLSIGKSLISQISQSLVTEIWQEHLLYAGLIVTIIVFGFYLVKILRRN